jgi:hypothetical protein
MCGIAKYTLARYDGVEGPNGNRLAEETLVGTRQQLKRGRKKGCSAKYSLSERISRNRA